MQIPSPAACPSSIPSVFPRSHDSPWLRSRSLYSQASVSFPSFIPSLGQTFVAPKPPRDVTVTLPCLLCQVLFGVFYRHQHANCFGRCFSYPILQMRKPRHGGIQGFAHHCSAVSLAGDLRGALEIAKLRGHSSVGEGRAPLPLLPKLILPQHHLRLPASLSCEGSLSNEPVLRLRLCLSLASMMTALA